MTTEIVSFESKTFKALANSKRLNIIDLLKERELCVSSIAELTKLNQCNVSQHLLILRNANLLYVKKIGKNKFYGVVNSAIYDALDLIADTQRNNNKHENKLSS